jgi:hypothetical protein
MAMNWNQQVEDMMKTWTATQEKVWNDFFNTMQGMGKSQSTRMWESTLTVGEDMLKNMLKTQSEWMAAWVDGLGGMEGVPAQVVESARQFQEMAARWNKTQAELLSNWFGMLKKFAPARPSDAWTDMPQNMFKSWQDTTQSIMDAQARWMRSWMGKGGKPEDE